MQRVKASIQVAPGSSPSLLRQINSAAVLRAIRDAGPVSRPQLATLTGLSRPTVNDVVEALLEAGYVNENLAGPHDGARRPGPRARLLTFRSDLGHVLGLDIGANKLLAMVADLDGRILASERRRTADVNDADALLAAAVDTARAALDRAEIAPGRLSSAAVGTPGIVERSSGRITLAPQLPGWEGMPLAERLSGLLGCRVLAYNEVHLSVLAERWRGAIEGIDDAFYIQIGVGIGCGILIGGDLYQGATGAAGEIGYMHLADNWEHSMDGVGSFEDAAGGRAFARLGRKAAADKGGRRLRELAGGDPEAVNAEAVFAAAALGDRAARAVVTELVSRLARGIAAAVTLLDPATVVVGGGLSRAGEALLTPLEHAIRPLVPVPPRFVLSALGDEAVALGGVKVALEATNEELFAFDQEVI